MWQDLQQILAGTSTLQTTEILARLLLAFIISGAIAGIYAWNYRGYGRPSQMALVLVLVALATCGIIMAIGDNLALSLGMVGALSIVRFRAAVKDNRDLAYLFWTLAIGLVCGAGVYRLALLLLATMGGVVVALERFALFETSTRKFIVIVSQRQAPAEDGSQPALPSPGSLLPAGAQLKSSTYHRDSQVEESTFLVDFAGTPAIETFKQAARADASISGFQILGPEDAILG
jgi:Domain of unknown function (DUF4956)